MAAYRTATENQRTPPWQAHLNVLPALMYRTCARSSGNAFPSLFFLHHCLVSRTESNGLHPVPFCCVMFYSEITHPALCPVRPVLYCLVRRCVGNAKNTCLARRTGICLRPVNGSRRCKAFVAELVTRMCVRFLGFSGVNSLVYNWKILWNSMEKVE